MRVLILSPELESFRHKSLGISILSGYLKKNGHSVDLFDSAFYDQKMVLPDRTMAEKEKTILYWFLKSKQSLPKVNTLNVNVVDAFNRKLDAFQPDLILVSSTFLSHQIGINIIASSNARNSTVIYGGIHCTLSPEKAISYDNVKYMHVGEGEISLPIIMKKLEKKESLDDCPNLWVKKDDGTVVRNPMVDIIRNLDDIPFYEWDIYNDHHFLRLYEGNVYRMGDYATSRGCVNRCSYCFNKLLSEAYHLPSPVIRRYSVERAIEELVHLKEKYSLTFIKFHDSDFLTMSSTYLDKFSSLYRRYVDIPNTLNACVEHISEEKTRYLIRMNCRSVSVGLESGNEHIRNQIMKRHRYTNAAFIENVEIMRRNGLRVSAPCMIGLPDETKENMMETITVAKRAKVDHADFGIFFPFPNLPLTEYAIKEGYLEKDQKLDNIIFGIETPLKLKMSYKELSNFLRCTMLYLKLPYILWPLVKYVEKYNTDNGIMWRFLRKLYFLKLHIISSFLIPAREKRRKKIMEKMDI